MDPLPGGLLPESVRSRFVEGVNGLRVHILEAGYEGPERPMILLLHGFPELAYSWRKVMGPLAAAGYHVVAPDVRGYGRTTGFDASYDCDVEDFRLLHLTTDAVALVFALGRKSVAAVVGHDLGSPLAAWCAIARPDVFPAVVLMSAPFGGTPLLPFDTNRNPRPAPPVPDIHRELAELERPRKHYVWYYATRHADADMLSCPQGLHAFLRAYYHVKSADWDGNRPHPLKARTADELAKLPTYYIMDRDADMAATVAPFMPSPAEVARCAWLTEAELAVYAGEFERTGFQGALNCYRGMITPRNRSELVFAGRKIDVPSTFIAGANDWGIYQTPGAFEVMQGRSCTQFTGAHLIAGAGHWVQQERPEQVTQLVLEFLSGLSR
ncbi:MAG: alpha/beta hydrolase [Hyphomonadaceae bacterium]